MASRLTPEELAHRWRRLAIGQTVAGVLVSVVVWIVLPFGWAIGITALMFIGVAENWHLDRRIRRTGRITR